MQNKAQLVLYDTKGNANNIYYEEETEGWLRIQSPLYHDQYVIIVKLQDSGTKAGRFLHATRFEYKNGALVDETDLTPGTNEVVSLLLVDHARSRLYYLGTELDKPSHKNLYSVQLGGTESPVCLSCELLTPEGKFFFFPPVLFFSYSIFEFNRGEKLQEIVAPTPTPTSPPTVRITRCIAPAPTRSSSPS